MSGKGNALKLAIQPIIKEINSKLFNGSIDDYIKNRHKSNDVKQQSLFF